MVDVIVSPDELSVVGGPATVNVEVDFGPAGPRGSQIFVGQGQPNNPATVIGQEPKALDLYINLAPATIDEEYLNVYQYQNIDGNDTWVRLFDLLPQNYSVKRSVTFNEAGIAEFYIPVANITPVVAGLTYDNFNIQYSIQYPAPVASSLFRPSLGELENIDGVLSLPVTIIAQAYDAMVGIGDSEAGFFWSPLNGEITVNLFITMV
jgi:hypothetical protein